MKVFLRIVSIIIEIIVAVAIFMMVVQKTPLFDRAIPGRSDTSTSPITTIQDQTIPSSSGSNEEKLSELLAYENKSETIIDQPVYSGKSCASPWGTSISDNNSIIAYRTQRASTDNQCYSEIRTCQDGKLWGSFIYKTCDYIIDGQLIKSDGTREDIIAWASDSTQRLIDLSAFYKKIQTTPKEYIQPKPYKDSALLNTTQAKPQKMDNSKIIINQDLTDTLDQTIQHDDTTNDKASCRTPWGERIDHGSFVYAYNYPTNTLWQSCSAQKRSCDDGILRWTYRYESCTFNTQSNTPQAIVTSKPSTIYKWTLSPYSPYVRPIGDTVRDTLLRSHSSNSASTSTVGQNYIEISNCLTPWGRTAPNLLCTTQSDVIPSSSHETWLEKNVKSIGKDANNARWWVKGWFK